MNDRKGSGYQGRNTQGRMGRPDTSLTESQTGADTQGRSPDYMDKDNDESARRTSYVGNPGASAGATRREDLGANVDGMGRDRTDAVATDETGKLISADKVIGTAVYNADGERLGTIDSIMLHKASGRVAFAVMSFGGFLGIGERYHPLPWDVLTYDEAKGGYNIDLTPDRLRSAPHYSREELNRLDYDARGRDIRDYYGVPTDPAYAAGTNAGGSSEYGNSMQGTTRL